MRKRKGDRENLCDIWSEIEILKLKEKIEGLEKKNSILIQKDEKLEMEILNLIEKEVSEARKRNILLVKKNERIEKNVSYFCPHCGKKIIERRRLLPFFLNRIFGGD